MKLWPLLMLLLAGCASRQVAPVAKVPLPPRPLFSRLLVAPVPTKPIIPLHLPPFVFNLPPNWQTNHWHWRVMRSTDLQHWQAVCDWAPGKVIEIYLPQGLPCYYMRLESYIAVPPPAHVVDPSPL